MSKKRVKEFGLINLNTGEMYGAVISPWQRHMGGKWMRTFQDAMKDMLINNLELHGESYKVLHFLGAVAKWNNELPSSGEVAIGLSMKQAGVSRAYRELREAGFIIQQDDGYYLNPLIYWKGNQQQFEQAVQKMAIPNRHLLQRVA